MKNLLQRKTAGKRVYIKTYGCQMNEHDSLKIEGLLAQQGFHATPNIDDADLVLFNTCTIREKAEQKAMSEIGRTRELKTRRPDLLVGVCGCVAQQEKETLFKRFPHIDVLFGPDQIGQLPALLEEVQQSRKPVSALALVNTPTDYAFLDIVPWAQQVQASSQPTATAFVTIMKGCDANCAYCIVPRVRGEEVCRPTDEIVEEIRQLAQHGVKEVTLLGQTVNTYGNRRHNGVMPFHTLLDRIAEETAIARIRFTSPHPKDVTAELADAYRRNPKLCPHIHLPLQAGSDRVLRSMRRSYSQKQYLAKVEQLRAARPDIAITTDVIVGFPGETEADFQDTMQVTKIVQYDGMYAFKYSPRPGTTAGEEMPDDVNEDEKSDRLARLLQLNEDQINVKYESKVGTTHDVLIEGRDRANRHWTGRTPHNAIVHCTSDQDIHIGDILPITITRAFGYSLQGEAHVERIS